MPSYLDIAGFKSLSTMPSTDVDGVEALYPGFVLAQLEHASTRIDGRLRKRYAVPFALPYPETVKVWLAHIVTVLVMLKRGVDPNDEQFAEIKALAQQAHDEVKEAADGELGLWDLPLRADTTESGISRGGPLGYSEQSPYVAFDLQSEAGRLEDRNGRGSDG
jgi:phage gp36-like protein